MQYSHEEANNRTLQNPWVRARKKTGKHTDTSTNLKVSVLL